MQEYLWEIWSGKQNTHHRVHMDLNETPRAVFNRLVGELRGTDKEIRTRTLDPNTGQEVTLHWRFACRMKGETKPLQENMPFGQQGVEPGALFVLRPLEIRANTIYVDGIEGLQGEEIAVAKNRTPLVGLLVFLLLLGGAAAFYFFVYLPAQRAKAPHQIKVATSPKGSLVTLVLDVGDVPNFKEKFKIKDRYLQRLGQTNPKERYTLLVPKKSKIIYVKVEEKGYQTWQRGAPLKDWEKDPKKYGYIQVSSLLQKGYFPTMLQKALPPKKKEPAKSHAPKAVELAYPAGWKPVRVGVDPLLGGSAKGPLGASGKSASSMNLLLAKSIQVKAKGKFRVALSRSKDAAVADAKRSKAMRKATGILQLDMASGLTEEPKFPETVEVGGNKIEVNNGVAGFQLVWSDKNGASAQAKKMAVCLGTWLTKAGFKPRPARKGETMTDAKLGIRPLSGEDAVLQGKIPAVRLVAGYITHRAEEAIFLKRENRKLFATAVEGAFLCFAKK